MSDVPPQEQAAPSTGLPASSAGTVRNGRDRARDAEHPLADPRLTLVRLDVTDPDQVAEAARTLTDVDVVINNAGIAHPTTPLAADLERARQELEVNYLGILRVAQAFPDLKCS